MMHRADECFPFRQATRLVNEFQMAVTPIGLDMADRNFERMAVLLLMFRNALRPGTRQEISMHALATSLGRPPETVRRHVQALAALGYCRQEGRGMRLDDSFWSHPRVINGGDRLAKLFGELLDGFEQTGFSVPDGAREQPCKARITAALDICLSAFELGETRLASTLDLYVIGAITVHNAANITHDPTLAERYGYAETVPPLDLRRPLSVRALAAIDGMPYATIWRHVAAAERAGVVRQVPGGYVLTDRWIDSAETSERSRVKIRFVRRVISDLARCRLI